MDFEEQQMDVSEPPVAIPGLEALVGSADLPAATGDSSAAPDSPAFAAPLAPSGLLAGVADDAAEAHGTLGQQLGIEQSPQAALGGDFAGLPYG